MKKKMLLCCGIVIILCSMTVLYVHTFGAPVVGTIHGAEWEYLSVGEELYEKTYDSPVHRADKGSFIGIVTNGDTKFRIYSIKGTDEYLYCQWEWEGQIYKRTQ